MELQQLKYFKTVAQIGKISEAAEALFVSAPALSTSISRLEKELGMPLFDRTSNRITLNAQGQIFLKYVNQVFASLDSAKQELRQSVLYHGPHLSLVSLNTLMWVNLIAAFTSEHSQFTLSSSTLSISKLAENGLSPQHNFLLAYDCEIPSAYKEKLSSAFLFRVTPSVMVNKDHPLVKKDKLRIRDLADERLFLPSPNTSMYNRLQQLFQLEGLNFPADYSYSFLIRQKMVAEGSGISFFSQYPGYNPHPNIRYIPLDGPFDSWDTYLYWRKDRPLTESEQIFRDFAVEFCRELH